MAPTFYGFRCKAYWDLSSKGWWVEAEVRAEKIHGCRLFLRGVAELWAGVAIKRWNPVSGAGQRKHRGWIECVVRQAEPRRLVYWESDPGSWQGTWDRGSRSQSLWGKQITITQSKKKVFSLGH